MKTENLFISCVMVAVLSIVAAISYNSYNETQAMQKNIDSAIAKGIDPLAVKCAWSKYGDNICITYTMTLSKK